MLLADTLNVVGGGASVVAAVAALLTVVYARATVGEARAARREAEAAHSEETRQQAQLLQATKDAHAEELRKQAELLEATMAAHQQELTARKHALASELVFQRLVQLGRVTDLLGVLADAARNEAADPPPQLEGNPIPLSRIPGALVRLRAAISMLEAVGGPPLPQATELATGGHSVGTNPMRVYGDAQRALTEAEFLGRNDESLALPAAQTETPATTDNDP